MKLKDGKNDVDIIVALEDWDKLKAIAYDFSFSQGFYGRLLRDMMETEDYYGRKNIEFPIYF